MKKVASLLATTLAAAVGWMASEWFQVADAIPTGAPPSRAASHAIASGGTTAIALVSDEWAGASPSVASTEIPVAPEVLAPLATVTTTIAPPEEAIKAVPPPVRDPDAPRRIIIPIVGVDRGAMRDMFSEGRGDHRHEAIDIMAARGTPVIAVDDGVVKKLFTSKAGGLTVYEFDPDERFCYYYAHLDRYAAGLHEGQRLRRGEVLGYVGSTGNASENAPHLHFALIRLDPDKRWWKGTYVNPYPLFAGLLTP